MTATCRGSRRGWSSTPTARCWGLLEGEYASAYTGRSMELNDLREYVRGDDVRDLEWKASARSGQLLVKRFVATRKHTVLLVVSTGRSMAAVNDEQVPKRELAVFVAGLLGWLAIRHGDVVGAVYGDAAGQHRPRHRRAGETAPRAGPRASPRRARPRTAARATPPRLLEQVARVVRRRTIMVLVCDELRPRRPAGRPLRHAGVPARGAARHRRRPRPHRGAPTCPDRRRLPGLGAGWVAGDRRLAQDTPTSCVADRTKQLRQGAGPARHRARARRRPRRGRHGVFRLLERHRRGRRR